MMRRKVPALLAVATAAAMLALPGQAFGGRLVATGHDADSHCSGYDNNGQCHFVQVAVGYVRGGAPVPSRPLLVLDCSPGGNVSKALANAAVPGGPHQAVCPSANVAAFNALRLTTATFSAMVVGSSLDALSLTDTAAINARKADIATFFNAGGGILAFAGDSNGDDPADPYYQFAPIGIGGKAVTSPFRLTTDGQALGFQDSVNGIGTNDDINCCPTHNSFQEPAAGSALQVAERDASVPPAPETLFADGTISGGKIVKKPVGVIGLPSNRKCVSRRKFQDPHPPAGRHPDPDGARLPEREEDPRPHPQGLPEEAQGRERQSARPAAGQVQGAHRGLDERGQDPARHSDLPHLHEEAQVEEAAEAVGRTAPGLLG